MPQQPPTLSCLQCTKTYASTERLSEHMNKRHRPAAPTDHQCKHCPESFPTFAERAFHTQAKHPTAPKRIKIAKDNQRQAKSSEKVEFEVGPDDDADAPTCLVCGISNLANVGEFRRHVRDCHSTTHPFACSHCYQCFATSTASSLHYRTVHRTRLLCDQCPATFINRSVLRAHLLYHTGKNRFKCDTCHAAFASQGKLNDHLELAHAVNEKVYACDVCSKSFRTWDGCKEHMRTVHDALPLQCPHYPSTFKSKRSHAAHLKVHTGGGGDFVCTLCNDAGRERAFRSRTDLQTLLMLKIHRANPCFACGICGSMQGTAQLVALHLKRRHSGHTLAAH